MKVLIIPIYGIKYVLEAYFTTSRIYFDLIMSYHVILIILIITAIISII